MRPDFENAVEEIVAEDRRYDREAYAFVRDALDHTVNVLKKPRRGAQRHVTGKELLEGIRVYAMQQFGPVTKLVLNSWGLARTADFGDIVFNLVNKDVLGKTDSDRKEDFHDAYDFDQAFVKPYLAPTRPARTGTTARARPRGKQRTSVEKDK
jgi:uncharacterized repeat protein (TIGR04138 family)